MLEWAWIQRATKNLSLTFRSSTYVAIQIISQDEFQAQGIVQEQGEAKDRNQPGRVKDNNGSSEKLNN